MEKTEMEKVKELLQSEAYKGLAAFTRYIYNKYVIAEPLSLFTASGEHYRTELMPALKSTEQILLEYFGIDYEKYRDERKALLRQSFDEGFESKRIV